jgi:hypothetical protein
LVAAELPDAIDSAARDVTEAPATDAIEVEGLDAGVAAKDVGPPEAVAAGESPVQDEFVVARGGPAVGLAASEVAAETGPDELRVGWGVAGVEWAGPQVEKAAIPAGLDESVARRVDRGDCPDEPWVRLDGSPVAWGEWVGLPAGCPVEPQGDWFRRVSCLVGLDDFQVDRDEWVELLVDRGD